MIEGEVIYMGNLTVEGYIVTGVFIETTQMELSKKNLMYKKVIVSEKEE